MSEKVSTSFRTYLRAFGGDWFTRMSGPATVPFVILAIYFPNAPLKVLFTVLAVGCGVSSSYCVWRRERLHSQVGRANLVTYAEGQSRFYVLVGNPQTPEVLGIYLEVRLAIENKGDRSSIIRKFGIAIDETNLTIPDLKFQHRAYVQTRGSQHGTATDNFKGTSVVVDAQNLITSMFPFFLENANPGDLSELHCSLILTDTEGTTAKHTFVATKVG